MSKTSLISVIMPFYNPRFNLFQEAVESVLSQSYVSWELIIVNDGSNLKRKNDLEAYISKINDKRILILTLDKNYGVAAARNKGIKASRGEIITFLSTDDFYLPWHCQEIIDNFNDNPDSLILGAFLLHYLSFWNIKRLFMEDPHNDLFEGREDIKNVTNRFKEGTAYKFPLIKFVYKKKVFDEITYDEDLLFGEDIDFIFQIINNKNFLEKTIITHMNGHLCRMHSFKKRLSRNWDFIVFYTKKLIEKHSNKDLKSYRVINEWRSSKDQYINNPLLYKYLTNNSVFQTTASIFLEKKSLREKIKCLKILTREAIVRRFLMPILGVNIYYIKKLISSKGNKFKLFKSMFKNHLKNPTDINASIHAKKIFERTF